MLETGMETYRQHMERTPDSILYIETDIPPHMTHSDWRRSKQAPRRRLISRLRGRRAGLAAAQRTA
jgi:hypothetical protein